MNNFLNNRSNVNLLNHNKKQDNSSTNNNVFTDSINYLGNLNQESPNNNKNEKPEKTQRKLYIDLQTGTSVTQPEKYCDNSVRTSQYTLYSFLPLAIINQYKTPFNWFFLIQAIIDCIPSISSVNPITTIMPVVIVLIIKLFHLR